MKSVLPWISGEILYFNVENVTDVSNFNIRKYQATVTFRDPSELMILVYIDEIIETIRKKQVYISEKSKEFWRKARPQCISLFIYDMKDDSDLFAEVLWYNPIAPRHLLPGIDIKAEEIKEGLKILWLKR